MILLLSIFSALILFPFYKSLLFTIGSLDYNFNKRSIPVGFGGYILLLETFLYFIPTKNISSIWASLILITTVGTYDDFLGDKSVKGLRGHMTAFIHGKVTSGFLKALTGVVVAFMASIHIGDHLFSIVTHFLLILFMINMINLFDIRPGRALKVFFLLFLFLGVATPFLRVNNFGFVILGILLVVFYQDLHAKIMIGDSGANLIGLHLGIWYSIYIDLIWQWFIIFFLLFLHYYSEKKSISVLIENNKFLKRIDLLGRKGTI